MKKNTLLFDFDGTIINTNKLIEEGLELFAKTYRGTSLSHSEHKFLLGKPLEDQMKYINTDAHLAMTEIFKVWYLQEHNNRTSAFDGIETLIKFLRIKKCKLGIVSNNSRETVLHGLEHLRLRDYFDVIVTSDDVTEKKPSPEGLHKALFMLNSTADESLFIGDSSNDILAANHAGIENVLVGWSLMEAHDIETLDIDYHISHPSKLLAILGDAQKITA